MKTIKAIVCGIAAFGLAQAAHAQLVQNGNFQSVLVPGVSSQFGSQFPSQQVTGWTTGGYNWVYTPAQPADTLPGAPGIDGALALWGPADGSANGLTTSPAGGNYVAMDGNYDVDAVQQTITGLLPGHSYKVSFYWGGAQQYGFGGSSDDQLQVSLGAQTLSTPDITVASEGFSGWIPESFTYTATSTSEVLSFLAASAPQAEPPFTLLDGVSMQAVPDTASSAVLVGLTASAMGLAAWRRRQCRQ